MFFGSVGFVGVCDVLLRCMLQNGIIESICKSRVHFPFLAKGDATRTGVVAVDRCLENIAVLPLGYGFQIMPEDREHDQQVRGIWRERPVLSETGFPLQLKCGSQAAAALIAHTT